MDGGVKCSLINPPLSLRVKFKPIFEKKMVDPKMHQWDEHLDQIVADVGLEGEFVAFSILDLREELQYMKCKSAVGPDGIGVHLLRTMASHDELGPQLLALINQNCSRTGDP